MAKYRGIALIVAALSLAPVTEWGQGADAKAKTSDPDWIAQHQGLVKEAKGHPDAQLLLIGDSITENYRKAKKPDEDFAPTWETFYAPRKALNLGVSGDTTVDVVWRLDHGEVDGLHPWVAVVLIGTNNTLHGQTAEQTETGIDAVIGDLEVHLPETKILLLGILPSERSEAKSKADGEVNAYLARCYGDNPRVTYLDVGSIFYQGDALNTGLFYDPRLKQHYKALHPDTVGQRRMAEAMEPTLAKLMGDAPRVELGAMTEVNTAVIPVPRLEQDGYDWYGRHHAELALHGVVRPAVVMIGDSITHFWGGAPMGIRRNGTSAWSSLFGGTPAVNLGFGWDRTQNVLWRLRQGEMDGYQPKWVVLNIGTNNLTGSKNARANTPEEVAEGVGAIVREVRERSPGSRMVVMAIFPRGMQPDTAMRKRITATNVLLQQRFAGAAGVTYLDIGEQFLQPDGTLPKTMMPDGTHPGEAGYRIWAEALRKVGVGR